MKKSELLLWGGNMRRIELSSKSFLITLLIVLSTQIVFAQANRATITGTVTDSSGAMVSGVEVTATNTGTNIPTTSVSNEAGVYTIPNLFPGPYSVTFKKSG